MHRGRSQYRDGCDKCRLADDVTRAREREREGERDERKQCHRCRRYCANKSSTIHLPRFSLALGNRPSVPVCRYACQWRRVCAGGRASRQVALNFSSSSRVRRKNRALLEGSRSEIYMTYASLSCISIGRRAVFDLRSLILIQYLNGSSTRKEFLSLQRGKYPVYPVCLPHE